MPEPDAKRAAARGLWVGRYTAQPNGAQLQHIADLMDGKVRVHVDGTFPLAQAAEAQEALRKDHVRGKLVLTVQ